MIIILVLYEYKIWFLTVTEEHRLKEFENKVLEKISQPKKDGINNCCKNYITSSFRICMVHAILLEQLNQEGHYMYDIRHVGNIS